ncbi:MAG TPA: hypothetical protein VEU30_15485 [Thermoanaerobaculia bacterium]|nr:hypothetical protein [Thermoanaerobaculia bacterium]
MTRAAWVLSLLLTVSVSADCIEQGHYAIVAHAGTLRGTAWPYSEDLASRSDQLPVGDPSVIAYTPDLRWTKLQTGCESYGERNVYASETVNLILRASFAFSDASKRTAVTGARYQVQLRLDDEVVLDEVRRLDGRYPQSHRFAAVARNVPKGAYVYSMWFRLLDGPDTNQVTIGLQWITSQGMPAEYPAAAASSPGPKLVSRKWTPIGPAVRIETKTVSDLILLSSIDAGQRLVAGYSIEQPTHEKAPPRKPTIIDSSLFDQRPSIEPGTYVVRLWARTLDGEPDAIIETVRTDVAAFPLGRFPMFEFSAEDLVEVTPAGSANDEPVTLSPVCGRWTRLLDFETPSVVGDFSWFLHANIEFPRVVGHGYVEIAVQTVRKQPSVRLGIIEATDMGIAVAQLSPGGDAISFYGDASSWGNDGGNEMSLWIRIIEGCNGAGFGNALTVGKRSVAIKLLPTTSIHLP